MGLEDIINYFKKIRLSEIVVRTVNVDGVDYLCKSDVLRFLKRAEKGAQSLNAKADIRRVIDSLNNGKKEGDGE
jgi:hypothetical protein